MAEMNLNLKSTLDYARMYVSKGYPVIPIKYKDKEPATLSWKEYQDRLPTDEELISWFADGSKYNIAIVTGRVSGIVAVDLDSPKAVKFAKVNNFPLSPLSQTGKGYHIIYRYKDGVRNFQKRDDLPDIDLRGDGGYIVVEPSIHPSGGQYRWVEGKGLDDLPFAEIPEIILAKNSEQKTSLKELYRGVPEGQRNDSLTRIIGSLVNDGLSYDECLEFAILWNTKNAPPEIDQRRIERTVRSICEKHYREQSNSPSIYSVDNKDNRDNARISTVGELDLSKALRTGSDLQMLDIPVEWAVQNLIPLEGITLLSAKGGMGKTTISMQAENAMSKGNQFLGLETLKRPVVHITFEDSLPVIIKLIKRIGASDVFFWHTTNEIRPPRLDSKEWEFYKKLPQGAVLFFDTLRAAQSRDENDSQHMAFIMQRLKELRDLGFTIVLLHHTPKANEKIYKGSTCIFDLSDHVLSLHKVRKGNYKEIDDDDDTGDYCYRLGTRDKTRYEPYHMFLEFDKEKRLFVIAQDPDIELIEAIYDLLADKDELNTNQVYDLVKKELDIKGKAQVIKLLKKGAGKYWNAEIRGRAIYYRSQSPDIYSIDYKTDLTKQSKTAKTDTSIETSQSIDNSIKSNSPEDIQTDKTNEVIDLEHEEVEIVG